MVREYPWSKPVLRKLDHPVDAKGQPWTGPLPEPEDRAT
jgi:hypothetical protein